MPALLTAVPRGARAFSVRESRRIAVLILQVTDPSPPHARRRSVFFTGIWRTRLPVAA